LGLPSQSGIGCDYDAQILTRLRLLYARGESSVIMTSKSSSALKSRDIAQLSVTHRVVPGFLHAPGARDALSRRTSREQPLNAAQVFDHHVHVPSPFLRRLPAQHS
jgi:hypothetical protein